MYAQVGGNFRSRLNRFVGNDDIAGTVIQNTDDRTVVHRPTRQIPHTHIGSYEQSNKKDMKSILDNRPELAKEVNKVGNTREKIRTTSPVIRTVIVRVDTPFHSFNKIPHTLLKVTFKAINIHHEKASSTGLPVRKLLPISKPKNCIYHSTPAKAQNIKLFPHTLLLA